MPRWRQLLRPFSPIYGLGSWGFHALYALGLAKAIKGELPAIVVGNLSTGGTGKTPLVQLIARLCQTAGIQVAVLSRGYGRKSQGYALVRPDSTAADAGDEPLLHRLSLPESVPVVACAERLSAIKRIKKDFPQVQAVILDDGFQHRKLLPDFSLLLIQHGRWPWAMRFLPAGDLREGWQAHRRADAIAITKSPMQSLDEQLPAELHHLPHVFRFTEEFKPLSHVYGPKRDPAVFSILAVAGLAHPESFFAELRRQNLNVEELKFKDHHPYDEGDLKTIAKTGRDVLITTAKDWVKLANLPLWDYLGRWSVFVLPVSAKPQGDTFEAFLLENVRRITGSR